MGYNVRTMPRLRIHDVYYDTPRRLLGRKSIGLRIRKIHGRIFLSMKSDPRPTGRTGVRRNEFESPWSHKSLTYVLKKLRQNGLPLVEPQFSKSKPSIVLARLGFKILQERQTTRDVRQILQSSKTRNRPLAEVDIDRVTFLGKPKVRIYEVEIEAKSAGSMRLVQRIGAELESNYSGFLKVWPHGKLVTGLAIRQLTRLKGFSRYLSRNELKPKAFDAIDRTIVAGRLGGPA